MSRELQEAGDRIVRLIQSAGGPAQLSNGVQLGQISWAVKMTAAIERWEYLTKPQQAEPVGGLEVGRHDKGYQS